MELIGTRNPILVVPRSYYSTNQYHTVKSVPVLRIRIRRIPILFGPTGSGAARGTDPDLSII